MAEAQNIVVSLFAVESEAYQALTELRRDPGTENSYLATAALVKKENGVLQTLDGFDTGVNTSDDMIIGGLIGALFGVLGGPIGVLLGGGYGALVGSAFDSDDMLNNVSMLEQIATKMEDGEIAIIGLSFEEDEAILDQRLNKFKTTIVRFDAAAVAEEVEQARELEKEMARQARRELRSEKKEARKEKRAEKKEKLSAEWQEFKGRFKKDKE